MFYTSTNTKRVTQSVYDVLQEEHAQLEGDCQRVNQLFFERFSTDDIMTMAICDFSESRRFDWANQSLSKKDLWQIATRYTNFASHHNEYLHRRADRQASYPRLRRRLRQCVCPASYYAELSAIAYYDPKRGSRLPGLNGGSYIVGESIHGAYGLHAYLLLPDSGEQPPIILFRGTDPNNGWNLRDDACTRLGSRSFDANKERLLKLLEKYGHRGPFVTTGHSLGGTLAQRLAAAAPQHFSDVYHFNAPGIGFSVPGKFGDVDPAQRPIVHAVHHARDLGYRSGLWHLPADEEVIAEETDSCVGRSKAHAIQNLAQLLREGKYKTECDPAQAAKWTLGVAHAGVEALRMVSAPALHILASMQPHPPHLKQRLPVDRESQPQLLGLDVDIDALMSRKAG